MQIATKPLELNYYGLAWHGDAAPNVWPEQRLSVMAE
jgi:hypothetical protein